MARIIVVVVAAGGNDYDSVFVDRQHSAKNPNGYCPDHSTGIACPVGLGVRANPQGTGVAAI